MRGARTRLPREGRLLTRLAHPNIVRGYEVHGAGRPAIVMETLTGATVEQLVRDGSRPLGATELANLGAHLASALRYLHRAGVLHCDLSGPTPLPRRGGRS